MITFAMQVKAGFTVSACLYTAFKSKQHGLGHIANKERLNMHAA